MPYIRKEGRKIRVSWEVASVHRYFYWPGTFGCSGHDERKPRHTEAAKSIPATSLFLRTEQAATNYAG